MQKFMTFLTVFLLMFCLSIVSVYAEAPNVEELPNVPESQFENTGYVLFYNPSDSGGTTYLYYYNKDVVTEKPFISQIPGSGNFQANLRFLRSAATNSEWLYIYKLSDDVSEWDLISYVSANSDSSQYYNAVINGDGRYPDSITTQFYYSSDGVYYNDVLGLGGGSRDFFPSSRFPMTLWEAVETSLQELMTRTQSSMVLLASLGIGLMACLILVVLLSTKFRLFLK